MPSLIGVVGGVPVGHEDPVESPLVFEDVDIDVMVLRGVDAVDKVVRIHDGADFGFAHGGLEGRKVNLTESTFVDVGAEIVAVELLVVSGIVFGRSENLLALNAFDQSDSHAGGKKRILAQILEIAAAHGSAVDVHTGSEDDVDAAGAGVFAHRGADAVGEVGVPGSGEGDSGGIGGGEAVVVYAHGAVGHAQRGDV